MERRTEAPEKGSFYGARFLWRILCDGRWACDQTGRGPDDAGNVSDLRNMVTPEAEVLVRRVFLLALDQPKAQVETLPQVATVLQRPDLIAQWIEAPDTAAALAALRQGPGSWQS